MLKYLLINIGKILYSIFTILPIKNHVLCYCYNGKKIEDNIVYLYDEFIKKGINVYFVYSGDQQEKKPSNYIKKYSWKFFVVSATARIVVTNVGIAQITVKRKNQIFINTWHGAGGLKGYGKESANISFNIYDYFVAESKMDEVWFSDKNAWNFHNAFLETGMPRNDVLVKSFKSDIEKVRLQYNIPLDAYVVLYAPTWRESKSDCFIDDFKRLKDIFESKFDKKVIILYKKHHLQKATNICHNEVIDCSEGYEIQKLLLLVDFLITDYSSCAWDFSLTKKPVALYIPDYQDYIVERGNSFIDYSKLPYIIAKTQCELFEKIESFNYQEYQNSMTKFHNYMVVFNKKGDSLEKIMDLCDDILK